MQLTNSVSAYGFLSKLLHSVVGVLFIYVFYIGFTMTDLPDSDLKWEAFALHKSLGVSIFCLILIRFLLIKVQVRPESVHLGILGRLLSRFVHASLYVVMFLFPLSGYLMAMSGGYSVEVFGYHIPDYIGQNEDLYEISRYMHGSLVPLTFGLVGLHLSGALFNHFIKKNDCIKRISPFH